MLTVALVVMVIFLVPAQSVGYRDSERGRAASLVGTFAAMYARLQPGQHVDDGVDDFDGFVVDDAIVMIEKISRYIEDGESPMQAALKARTGRFTILSLTVSLIAVLIPLLFRATSSETVPGVCGDAGRYNRDFGHGVADHDANDCAGIPPPRPRQQDESSARRSVSSSGRLPSMARREGGPRVADADAARRFGTLGIRSRSIVDTEGFFPCRIPA